ncbi:MAG TPA: hypothetical protein VLJ57_07705 [Burkholderiaceae bacterium]|nr:hypothetical protein [Burkholderiaceae bacterium]
MLRKTTTSFKNSVQSLLGSLPLQSTAFKEGRIDEIRLAMLACLGEAGARHFPHVERRIRFSGDVEGLWFLRGDVLAAVAMTHGEAHARKRIERITAMFKGLIPEGLNSRPSPLGD